MDLTEGARSQSNARQKSAQEVKKRPQNTPPGERRVTSSLLRIFWGNEHPEIPAILMLSGFHGSEGLQKLPADEKTTPRMARFSKIRYPIPLVNHRCPIFPAAVVLPDLKHMHSFRQTPREQLEPQRAMGSFSDGLIPRMHQHVFFVKHGDLAVIIRT